MTQISTLEQTLRKGMDAWNSHDSQALARVYAPNAVVHDPFYPEPLRGIESIRKAYDDLITSYPDFRLRLEDAIAGGDTVAAEWTCTGTNTGPLKLANGTTMPATNRRFTVRGANVIHVDAQGRITEDRLYYDTMSIIQQLGLMPGA